MKQSLYFFLYFLLSFDLLRAQDNKTDYTGYIDPYIGTQAGGNTFPGVTYPFGMVKLGPDCGDMSSNMGYSHEGKIRGFSHLHVSGTGGGPKYGNIILYPFSGDVRVKDYGSDRDILCMCHMILNNS